MNIKYPLLIPIIGHGATDLIDLPKQTLIYNFYFALFVYNLNLIQRKTILTLFSIFHIAQDIPYKTKNINYIFSSFIHYFWIKKPLLAKLHLLCIHTPLHYLRCFIMHKNYKIKYYLGTIISIFGGFFLQKNYYNYFNIKYGELWYIGPVLAHVILNYKINNNFVNNNNLFNKNNKYKYYLFKYFNKNIKVNI